MGRAKIPVFLMPGQECTHPGAQPRACVCARTRSVGSQAGGLAEAGREATSPNDYREQSATWPRRKPPPCQKVSDQPLCQAPVCEGHWQLSLHLCAQGRTCAQDRWARGRWRECDAHLAALAIVLETFVAVRDVGEGGASTRGSSGAGGTPQNRNGRRNGRCGVGI